MTVSVSRIDDFVLGDDLEIERSITSIPTGIVIDSAWFMVKRKFEDTDAQALISKTISTVDTAGIGWIENTGGSGTGLIHFYITATDTALLTALSEYQYSIKLKFDNGKVVTPEIGVIVANAWVKQGST